MGVCVVRFTGSEQIVVSVGALLLYKVVLVSAVQQIESAYMSTYIRSLPYPVPQVVG